MRFVMAVILGCFAASSAKAGMHKGEAAYQRQDYATAIAEFLPEAKRGNARAAYELGRSVTR
jgi:hypothetical protein